MYRQYENPHKLEKQLEKLRKQYHEAKENNVDEDTLISMAMDIDELKERINFAWQDDEEN